jgi:hypothetical protein
MTILPSRSLQQGVVQTVFDLALAGTNAEEELALALMATHQMRKVRDPSLLTGCVEQIECRVSITSANINDGKAGPQALPDNPGEVFADSAYRGAHFCDAVRAKGGIPRIVATGMWGRDEQETQRKLHEWNQPIHRVRDRIEKIFRTWKRSYGLRRIRWRGLAKAAVQVHLTAIAYNLKRTMNILAAA